MHICPDAHLLLLELPKGGCKSKGMIKKGFLIGLLLFGIFFGAGNLIFPAELGFRAGVNFYPAILGFVLSGVGIAIITLVLGTMVKGGYKK